MDLVIQVVMEHPLTARPRTMADGEEGLRTAAPILTITQHPAEGEDEAGKWTQCINAYFPVVLAQYFFHSSIIIDN